MSENDRAVDPGVRVDGVAGLTIAEMKDEIATWKADGEILLETLQLKRDAILADLAKIDDLIRDVRNELGDAAPAVSGGAGASKQTVRLLQARGDKVSEIAKKLGTNTAKVHRYLAEIRKEITDAPALPPAPITPESTPKTDAASDSRKHVRGPKPRQFTFRGETLDIIEWARRCGVSHNTLYLRIRRGWSVERALTEGTSLSAVLVGAPAVEPAEPLPAAPRLPPAPSPSAPDLPSPGAPATAGASIVEMRAEVTRQQAGIRAKGVWFWTIESNGHKHLAIVDRMGDGSTVEDDTGHRHRVYRFVVAMAVDHRHDGLVVDCNLGKRE